MMQAYRYHMTLTDKMPKAKTQKVLSLLAPHLNPLVPQPFVIDALSLVGEDAQGRFHVVHRYALSG